MTTKNPKDQVANAACIDKRRSDGRNSVVESEVNNTLNRRITELDGCLPEEMVTVPMMNGCRISCKTRDFDEIHSWFLLNRGYVGDVDISDMAIEKEDVLKEWAHQQVIFTEIQLGSDLSAVKDRLMDIRANYSKHCGDYFLQEPELLLRVNVEGSFDPIRCGALIQNLHPEYIILKSGEAYDDEICECILELGKQLSGRGYCSMQSYLSSVPNMWISEDILEPFMDTM